MFQTSPLNILLGCEISILCGDSIPQVVVFTAKSLALLLQSLDVTIPLRELIFQFSNLAGVANLCQSLGFLALGFWVAFVTLDRLLQAKGIKDHDVGSVEDQREEECETT